MDWVIYLFGSGVVFFIGIGLVLAAALTFTVSTRRWLQVVATLLVVLGVLLVAPSATPLPNWFYAAAGAATLAWLAAERSNRAWAIGLRRCFRASVVTLWVVAAAFELPHELSPRLTASGRPTLYVIGDSVAAGMGAQDKDTWPRRLARAHAVEVIDLSRVGATAGSALKQADGLPAGGGMVLLEIGGNDVLGSTSAADFDGDLDRLLSRVCRPGRPVLMFELPLPPFCNDYGRIQRRLAFRYGVVLIPKRIFVSVLTGRGATLDSVHLTPAGHERMAEAVWSVIAPAYRE